MAEKQGADVRVSGSSSSAKVGVQPAAPATQPKVAEERRPEKPKPSADLRDYRALGGEYAKRGGRVRPTDSRE